MDNILRFELSPSQIKFKNILNKEFIELEIWAISDINPNRNNSHFTLESLEDAKGNVKNKPIVGFFENNDFTTHEGKADYDSEYQETFWNTERGERILGWVRESDPVEIVEKDGLHWLKFRCILCVTYCYRQVKRLLKDKKKKVSVEVTVHENEMVDGVEYIHKFTLNGVAILGSKNGKSVMEGIPGAHLSVLENLDDDMMQEQRRVLSFAYQQIDNENECYKIVDDKKVDDNNIEKEVNQADMNTVDINQIDEATDVTVEVEPVKEEETIETEEVVAETVCDNNDVTCDEDTPSEEDEPKSDDVSDEDPEDDSKDDDDTSDDSDDDKDDESEDIVVEDVAVEEVAPDVNVIVEDDAPVNEEDDSLSMTTEDIGVPQCEDAPIETDGSEPVVEASVNVIVADDDSTESVEITGDIKVDDMADVITDIVADNTSAEEEYKVKCAELEEKCACLERQLAEKDAKIAEYESKCSDYEEVCNKLYEAESKIKDRFYSDLELFAKSLMANENINKEYQKEILDKCSERHYSCEDDVKKDIAVAIYSSRPAKEKMFSISIPVAEEVVDNSKPLTREQYIKNYISKK